MGHNNLIILLFIAFFSIAYTNIPVHEVKYVYDGDTILMDNGEKVRYLGINAPEIGYQGEIDEFMSIQSRDYNQHLVLHRKVQLEFDRQKRDPHNRLLAYVYLQSGEMVNRLLVRQGLAHVMVNKAKPKYFSDLLAEQRRAMTKKIGIWQNEPTTSDPYYIANKKSYRFHKTNCPFGIKIHPKNKIRFPDYLSAFWEGMSPCKRCRP